MDYSGKKHSRGNFGSRSNGGSRSFGDRDDARPTLHKAICSECKAECQVPFKPSSSKPVFCRNCFKSKGDMGPKRSFGNKPSFGGKNSGMSNEQFKILNSKLDQILEALDA